uniref:Uncharacterized protein n=1 Tax=Oryza punctata TaxID=4537 RepID=A0A0E0MNK6_ORYPU
MALFTVAVMEASGEEIVLEQRTGTVQNSPSDDIKLPQNPVRGHLQKLKCTPKASEQLTA